MLKDIIIKNFEKEKEKRKIDKLSIDFNDDIEIKEIIGENKNDKIKR